MCSRGIVHQRSRRSIYTATVRLRFSRVDTARLPEMPKSVGADGDEDPYPDMTASQHSLASQLSVPSSPTYTRRPRTMRSRRPSFSDHTPDERTSLLRPSGSRLRVHSPTGSATPRSPRITRHHSHVGGTLSSRHHSRAGSFGQRLINALVDRQDSSMVESKGVIFADERVWYDQFTSTDWVHDSIADAYRVKALRARKGFLGKANVLYDGAQGWILSALVGFLVAVLAYCVNVAETTIFDFKDGYCAKAWYLREKVCAELLDQASQGWRWSSVAATLYGSMILTSVSAMLPAWVLY